jgi:hypothetical protein
VEEEERARKVAASSVMRLISASDLGFRHPNGKRRSASRLPGDGKALTSTTTILEAS